MSWEAKLGYADLQRFDQRVGCEDPCLRAGEGLVSTRIKVVLMYNNTISNMILINENGSDGVSVAQVARLLKAGSVVQQSQTKDGRQE